ncbi:MAG: S49 family peptidase [Pseudomonadota bacterium]
MSDLSKTLNDLWRALPFVGPPAPCVPLVELSGVIGTGSRVQRALNLRGVEKAIETAFKTPGAKAVALIVNSPGGSPVQSRLIHDRIRTLAEEKDLPVFAFAEDVAASGGYMLAVAGDEIYADESSIIGSIGVISAGFGFPDLLEKIGVERRVYTAGEDKSLLDPFQPENSDDVARLKAMQEDVHASFISLVKNRRGARLSDEEDLFTGAFWAGARAKALGLIDGVRNVRDFVHDRYGEDVKVKRIPTDGRSAIARLFGGDAAGPDGLLETLAEALKTRALWGRYGL